MRGTEDGGRIPIRLNGKAHRVREGQTVASLLEELEVDRRTVVVEVNRQIVRRTELEDVRLEPDDRVELVHFVGGGNAARRSRPDRRNEDGSPGAGGECG